MYLFIIDTDAYAGDFERELTAYITGQVGYCGVGEAERLQFEAECGRYLYDFEDRIGCAGDGDNTRPCEIWPTPGLYNDGQGNHYREDDDPAIVRTNYERTVRGYYGSLIEKAEERVAKGDLRWNRDIVGYQTKIEQALQRGPGKNQAYQSVAIYFSKPPTRQMVVTMADRAREYAKMRNFEITGFRCLHRVTEYRQVPLPDL